jgi:hypothetical protein
MALTALRVLALATLAPQPVAVDVIKMALAALHQALNVQLFSTCDTVGD